MRDPNPAAIAAAFVARWESAWNSEGAAATAQLYTPDAVLVGAATGVGQTEIARLLGLLYAQGWTRIALTVTNARSVGGVVLAACAFTAHGSGATEGKVLNGKSSHVLTRVGDTWLSAMHTAA
ncbi:MAG: nuclear transport factor 2 family protein [Stellaceae bacterium]